MPYFFHKAKKYFIVTKNFKGFEMILGKCPYCKDGVIVVKKKEVRGKKTELYCCSNASWVSEDGELWELSKDATCSFKLWQNNLAKYGKWLKHKEVRELLENKKIEVELVSKKYGKKIPYTKTVILNRAYGIEVLWET